MEFPAIVKAAGQKPHGSVRGLSFETLKAAIDLSDPRCHKPTHLFALQILTTDTRGTCSSQGYMGSMCRIQGCDSRMVQDPALVSRCVGARGMGNLLLQCRKVLPAAGLIWEPDHSSTRRSERG